MKHTEQPSSLDADRYGGFRKYGYPQSSSISNDGMFPNKNHPFGGSPWLWKAPPAIKIPHWRWTHCRSWQAESDSNRQNPSQRLLGTPGKPRRFPNGTTRIWLTLGTHWPATYGAASNSDFGFRHRRGASKIGDASLRLVIRTGGRGCHTGSQRLHGRPENDARSPCFRRFTYSSHLRVQ